MIPLRDLAAFFFFGGTMAILEKKFYDPGNGDFVGVTIRGALTPSTAAGSYLDPVLDVANPNELGLMIMEGHLFTKVGTFTAGAGTVSVGLVVKPRDTFSTFTLCTTHSAISAGAESNTHVPDTLAVGTGLSGKLGGLASAGTAGDLGKGYILAVGMPFYVPNVAVIVNTGTLTSAPLVDYLVFLRCIKTKRI